MSRLVLGQVLKGRKGSYQVIKPLTQAVYKANIEGTRSSVVLKTVPEDPLFFINEANFYHYDCITRSPYIRALREYVNDSDGHFLVFEWMDNTLWETKEESIEAKVKVFRRIAKSCLKALAVFQDMDGNGPYVHADLNPNNVLVSGFSSPTPVVKLADLGWTTRVEPDRECVMRIQGAAIRAPEIWKGASPTPASDIWSLGVSLAHWMSSRILFGVGGCNIRTNLAEETTEAGWCIAKLHKLRGAVLEGPIKNKYVVDWAIAERLLSENLVQTLTLREELEQKQVPSDCIAFIEHLLVVDPKKRPSVDEALAHPFLESNRPFDQQS